MTDVYDEDDYSEFVECWQCDGEGGRPSCQEDCCPALYGEENCTDAACWRRCDVCLGKGGWTREEPEHVSATAQSDQRTSSDRKAD